jgi:hypothetical protein
MEQQQTEVNQKEYELLAVHNAETQIKIAQEFKNNHGDLLRTNDKINFLADLIASNSGAGLMVRMSDKLGLETDLEAQKNLEKLYIKSLLIDEANGTRSQMTNELLNAVADSLEKTIGAKIANMEQWRAGMVQTIEQPVKELASSLGLAKSQSWLAKIGI